MVRWLEQRRLAGVSSRLRRARAELAVLDEQVVHFDDDAEDARLRAIVSDSPFADREHTEAERHAAAIRRSRVELLGRITSLEAEQDRLLGRLAERLR